jgi:hypothetical protein
MTTNKKDNLLETKKTIFDSDIIEHGYRDGVEIEKGVVLNEDYLKKHFKEIGDMLSIFSAYPDIFLDFITPSDSNF